MLQVCLLYLTFHCVCVFAAFCSLYSGQICAKLHPIGRPPALPLNQNNSYVINDIIACGLILIGRHFVEACSSGWGRWPPPACQDGQTIHPDSICSQR